MNHGIYEFKECEYKNEKGYLPGKRGKILDLFSCFLGVGVGKGSLSLQVTDHCRRKPRKGFKVGTEAEGINECY